MPQHTAISGHVIEYSDPEPKVAETIRQLAKMVTDPKVSEDEMIEVAYSEENPLLGPYVIPGRGAVTRDTLVQPAWHVIQDLLTRKYVAENGVDVNDWAAEYTLSMSEAARRLGVQPSAVREAIFANRLPAWVKDGRYYVSPRSLETYRVGKSGPVPEERVRPKPLEIRTGSIEGFSFRVRLPSPLKDKKRVDENIIEGRILTWRRVGILSGKPGKYHFYLLEPAEGEENLEVAGFYVRGHFKFGRKVNNSSDAQAAWKAFKAA